MGVICGWCWSPCMLRRRTRITLCRRHEAFIIVPPKLWGWQICCLWMTALVKTMSRVWHAAAYQIFLRCILVMKKCSGKSVVGLDVSHIEPQNKFVWNMFEICVQRYPPKNYCPSPSKRWFTSIESSAWHFLSTRPAWPCSGAQWLNLRGGAARFMLWKQLWPSNDLTDVVFLKMGVSYFQKAVRRQKICHPIQEAAMLWQIDQHCAPGAGSGWGVLTLGWLT